jgi:hypothetical protein
MFNYRDIDDKFAISGGWANPYRNAQFLTEKGITAVVDLQYDPLDWIKEAENIERMLASKGIAYLHIPMFDGPNKGLKHIYEKGYKFISEHYPNGRVLVKCAMGLSRSPSMLAYWYCKNRGMSFPEAHDLIYTASGEPKEISYNSMGKTFKLIQHPVAISGALWEFLMEKFPGYRSEAFFEELLKDQESA